MELTLLIPLIVIGLLASILIFKILSILGKRKYVLGNLLRVKDVEIQEPDKNKFLYWLSPASVLANAKRQGINFTYSVYIRQFTIGFILGNIIMFILYRDFILMELGAIVLAFVYPNLSLYRLQQKREDVIQGQLISYFKRFSSGLSIYEFNVKRTLEDIINTTEEPLKNDLELVLFDIKRGMDTANVFNSFNKKYPFNGVILFHDMVHLVSELGQDEKGKLKTAAKKFAKKKYWKRELASSNSSYLRTAKAVDLLSILIPGLLMIITSQFYNDFVGSFTGKATITLCLVFWAFTAYTTNKIAYADPTESK